MSLRDDEKVRVVGFTIHHPRVQPEQIVVSNILTTGRFGKHEVEVSAGKLITFLQERARGWSPFTILELVEFYQDHGWDPNLMFFGLCGPWFDDGMSCMGFRESYPCVAIGDDGKYSVTDYFVEACLRR